MYGNVSRVLGRKIPFGHLNHQFFTSNFKTHMKWPANAGLRSFCLNGNCCPLDFFPRSTIQRDMMQPWQLKTTREMTSCHYVFHNKKDDSINYSPHDLTYVRCLIICVAWNLDMFFSSKEGLKKGAIQGGCFEITLPADELLRPPIHRSEGSEVTTPGTEWGKLWPIFCCFKRFRGPGKRTNLPWKLMEPLGSDVWILLK